MPTLPLHPAFVHLPLGVAFALPLVASGIAIAVWRRALPRGALAVVAGLQLLLVGSGFVAMQLGERDEKRVEVLTGEAAIEEHEEAAEAFVWAGAAVLVLSVAVLLVPAPALAPLAALTVAGTLAVAALAVRTGHAGGKIVYQHGGAAAYAAPSAGRERADAGEDD